MSSELTEKTSRIVQEANIEKALDFLRDSAIEIGKARQDMILASQWVKHVEALETLKAEGSAEIRKATARASTRYVEAIRNEAVTAGEFEKLKALREAATTKIETWRTEQANYRGMRI